MKCSDARFTLAAEPSRDDPALAEHLAGCRACAAYAHDMRDLDRRLRAAMAIPVPDRPLPTGPYVATLPGTPVARRRPGWIGRGLALAASMAGVAVLAGLLWAGFPRESLASAVVAHMAEEPGAWSTTVVLPGDEVAGALARARVELEQDFPDITYAHDCWFRRHSVPHLVVRSPDGPVTILVLVHESVDARQPFEEGGYRGMLVPAERGSLAVLARDGTDIDAVARRALAAIRYLP